MIKYLLGLFLFVSATYAFRGLSGELCVVTPDERGFAVHTPLKTLKIGDYLYGFNERTMKTELAKMQGFLYVHKDFDTECVKIETEQSEFFASHNTYIGLMHGVYFSTHTNCVRIQTNESEFDDDHDTYIGLMRNEYYSTKLKDIKLHNHAMQFNNLIIDIVGITLEKCNIDLYMPFTELGNFFVSSNCGTNIHNSLLVESYSQSASSFKKLFSITSDFYSKFNPDVNSFNHVNYTHPLVAMIA